MRALIHTGRRFQIDRFPLAFNDAVTDLCGRLLQLGLLVGVIDLFHANATVRAMVRFETGVQAGMPDALTVAIAGKLADDRRYFGGQLVSVYLVRVPKVLSDTEVGR